MSNANEECRLSSRMKSALYSISSQLNVDEYNNLDTEDQFLILLNKIETALQLMKYDMKTSKFNNTNNTNITNYDDDGFEIDADTINVSNNKYHQNRVENEVLVKAKTLEDELRLSLQSMDNLQMLKNKNANLFKKLNSEKQQRSVLEKFVESQNKKIKLLILHIEKLMKTLKIESNKTMRSLETNRQLKLEEANLQMKIEKQVKIIAAQNKCIREIQEGSKILEDQLRLMDEKYVELRIRFDQSRGIFQNNVNKIVKENAELRKKFSLAFGTNMMLDTFDSNKSGNRIRAKSANSATKSTLTAAATAVTTSDNRLQSLQQFSPDGKYYKNDNLLVMSNNNQNLIYNNSPSNNKNNLNMTTIIANSCKVNTPSNNSKYNNNNNISSPERNHSAPLRRSVYLDNDSITKGIKEKDVLKKIEKRAKKKEWTREQLQELIPKF